MFKKGDKVKRVRGGSLIQEAMYEGHIYTVSRPCELGDSIYLEECDYAYLAGNFDLVEEPKVTVKEPELRVLTKREYFAGMALQGASKYLTRYDGNTSGAKMFATAALALADALIEELKK